VGEAEGRRRGGGGVAVDVIGNGCEVDE